MGWRRALLLLFGVTQNRSWLWPMSQSMSLILTCLSKWVCPGCSGLSWLLRFVLAAQLWAVCCSGVSVLLNCGLCAAPLSTGWQVKRFCGFLDSSEVVEMLGLLVLLHCNCRPVVGLWNGCGCQLCAHQLVINGIRVSLPLLLPVRDPPLPDVAVCKERLGLLTVGGTRKQPCVCLFVCGCGYSRLQDEWGITPWCSDEDLISFGSLSAGILFSSAQFDT